MKSDLDPEAVVAGMDSPFLNLLMAAFFLAHL